MREIDADLYDALELVAEMTRGVGSGEWFAYSNRAGGYATDYSCPACINGMRDFLTGDLYLQSNGYDGLPTVVENDKAVRLVQKKMHLSSADRVPFQAYAKQVGLVRKEASE